LNKLINLLLKKSGIYREFEPIKLKEIGINSKIIFYRCINLKYHYHAIFVIQNKTPLSMKKIDELNIIYSSLVTYLDHEFKKKILVLSVQVSKKVQDRLKIEKWRVIYGVL
jgi:hypothetical protein